MRDIITASVLIAATVGLICLIRLLSSGLGSVCKGPRVDLIIYFDINCECLEYDLAKIYSCAALKGAQLSVSVIDCVGTPESARWLEALRKKLKKDFDIITEEKSDGKSKYRDGQGNR